MLFQQESSQDKGLFTFYREQAEHQQILKRQKKLRKLRKQMMDNQSSPQQLKPIKLQPPKQHLQPSTIHHIRQTHPNPKPKTNIPKQRLIQSIIDMGKDIDPQPQLNAYKQRISAFRLHEPSIFLKKRYRQRQLNKQDGQDVGSGRGIDSFHIESFHRRNQSQQITPSKMKQAIHSVRSSVVQLPQIKKPQEIRVLFKPKKSIKSKLIEEALHSRDRDKIKQIRGWLKVQSPFKQSGLNALDQQMQVDERPQQIFQFKQQKLLSILKRFKRGL